MQRFSLFDRSFPDDSARRAFHVAFAEIVANRQTVIDAGCGRGVFLDLAREHGVRQTIGIDRDAAMVEATRARGHEAILGDVTTALRTRPQSADAIYSAFVIETMSGEEAIAFLEAATAALRPDGLLVIRTLNPANALVRDGGLWNEVWTKRPYPLETLHAILGDLGLRIVAAGHEPEGWQHTYIAGRAASAVATAPVQTSPGRPRVTLQGELFRFISLSHVNRELARALVDDAAIDLRLYADEVQEEPLLRGDPRCSRLREKQTPSLEPCDVLIRHASGIPDFRRPPQARRVVQIFPWEYGALPVPYTEPMRTQCDEIWTLSTYNRQLFLDAGFAPERVAVVPCGIDPALYNDAPLETYPLPVQAGFIFLFLGGTIRRKGLDVLLAAYRRAFSRTEDVALVIKDFGTDSFYLGTSEGAQRARAFANDPGAPRIAYLSDEVSDADLARIYHSVDAFVFPYRGEGFGLPMLEAMACGLPVIATAGGAADDYLDSTVAYPIPATHVPIGREAHGLPLIAEGWWLEPDVDALAYAMRGVVANLAEARARGALAAARARDHWTWSHAARIARDRLLALAAT